MTPVPYGQQTFCGTFPPGLLLVTLPRGKWIPGGILCLVPLGERAGGCPTPLALSAGHRAPQPQTICTLGRAKCLTQGPLSASTTAECWELPRNLQAGTLCLRGQGTQLRACVSEKQLCCDTLDGASAV